MSTEGNKAIVRRFFEEFWNAGQIDVADELIHPDYIHEDGGRGPENTKQGYAFWHQVLPDLHFTLEGVIAEGDTVVVRWTGRATHGGAWSTPIGTIPATGEPTTTPGTSTYVLHDGKIIRNWNHIDFLTTLHQIGATIGPSSANT